MTRFLSSLAWTVVVVAAGMLLSSSGSVVMADNTAAIIQLINNITLTGRTITTSGTTSEDKALKWLVTENAPQYQFTPGSKVNNTRLAQRYALATHYIQNGYPKNNWLSNQSECSWYAIGCSSDSNVTSIGNVTAFLQQYVVGTVPIEVGLLSSLRLVYWILYGSLPTTIGKWTDLDTVYFYCDRGYSTPLPAAIGDWRNVREVRFEQEGFTGSLPASIGKWTNLQWITIAGTSLNGTLPPSIGNWTNVNDIGINFNKFSGSLPTTIGRWSLLRVFYANHNQFTGMVPESIASWTGITYMDLSNNNFTGSLPIGNWVNLTDFNVRFNNFTGTIPRAVANWTRINRVELQNNSLVGTIPRSICSNAYLNVIYADCPNEVICWCCSRCAPPNVTIGETSGILFRELRPDAQDGSWGPIYVDIPGFDHVALSYLDSVYESHPGYKNGPYVSADRIESRNVPVVNGVQNVHTIETFKHNFRISLREEYYYGNFPVVNFKVIPIDNATALAMKNIITPRVNAAGFLAFKSVEEFVATHNPSAQKGSNGNFTGVGLIEWAAEQAGINNGQGFVPNDIESIITPNETFPLLSPELLYSALQNQELFFSTTYFLKGYFDPVDHVLTDPVGRRTGVVNRTQYNEIPNSFTSPKGDIDTIVVVNPIPGEYVLKVYGIPGKKGIASVEVAGRPSVTVRTSGNASVQEQSVDVPVVSGIRGDVNGDGEINLTDLVLLKSRISNATVVYVSTADMNGDGRLNQTDVDLLAAYLNRPMRAPTPPTPAPIRIPPPTPPRVPDVPVPIMSPAAAPKNGPVVTVPTIIERPASVPVTSTLDDAPKVAPVAAPIIERPISVPVAPTKAAPVDVPIVERPMSLPVAPTIVAPVPVPVVERPVSVPTMVAPVAVPIVNRPASVPVVPTKIDSPQLPTTPTAPRPLPTTTSSPVGDESCPEADKCSGGYMLHRTRLSGRCIERCISIRATQLRLRWKTWKCGKCEA